MKLPNVMTDRQAFILAAGAAGTAILLYIFGPVVAALLLFIAALSGAYGAVRKWAPELVDEKPLEKSPFNRP